MNPPDKARPRFPRAIAQAVAEELIAALAPACERIQYAGSLRREKPTVGDVELLFIPRIGLVPDGLFDLRPVPATDAVLDALLGANIIARRRNVRGAEMWGAKNKLAVHVASGIPVDLFAATPENWFNYLVCRTGPMESNVAIATAAQARGWKWNPYGPGFTDHRGVTIAAGSERDVFALAGLPFAEPPQRG